MTPKGSTQKLGAHSVGKHLVLRHYLDAWLPILAMTHPVVAFVDGFAGRGTYAGGEPGSPLIALNALMEHRDREKFKGKILFFFVEKNKTSAEHLKRLVQSIPLKGPPEIEVQVIGAPFEKAIVNILDGLQAGGREVPPSFVMIDPYGVSQTPLEVIRRILQNDSSEVYITFMYNFISRFRSEAGFEEALNSLFGANDWEPGRNITDTYQKKQFFYDLYKSKLKSAGAEFVVNFELYSGNRLYYPIFFGTKRIEGSDKMKQAIWRMDPTGGCSVAHVPVNLPSMMVLWIFRILRGKSLANSDGIAGSQSRTLSSS